MPDRIEIFGPCGEPNHNPLGVQSV